MNEFIWKHRRSFAAGALGHLTARAIVSGTPWWLALMLIVVIVVGLIEDRS